MAVVGNVAGAMLPLVLGRVVDGGLEHGLDRGLWLGCAVFFAVGMVQVGANVWGHRLEVENWLRAAFASSQLVGHHVTRTGDAITDELPTGEVVATVASDALRTGEVFSILPRLVGGIVAYLTLAAVLLTTSVPLGLLVLVGLPVVVAVLSLMVGPLQRRQSAQREAIGRLTTLGADTVSGLRVLRGIGGEEVFAGRYREQSQIVRRAGVGVARTQSLLDALQTLLPGLFLAAVVWAGAHLAVSGEISAGQLVSFYGFAAYLSQPLWTASEAIRVTTRAVVGARRIIKVLSVPAAGSGSVPSGVPSPAPDEELVDEVSGLVVRPGQTVALVSDDPDETARIALRLGRLDPDRRALAGTRATGAGDKTATGSAAPGTAVAGTAGAGTLVTGTLVTDTAGAGTSTPGMTGTSAASNTSVASDVPVSHVRWGRAMLRELGLAEVRERVVVAESTSHLFTGVLAEELDVRGGADREALLGAMAVADAADVLDSVPGGLDGDVEEKGRSLSGGQRQRVALARALLTEAEVLVLIEPTSAVDAHTEARIATRLADARRGRTTVLVTASPLVLGAVDDVALVVDGRVVGRGTHVDLLHADDEVGHLYRAVVSRSGESGDGTGGTGDTGGARDSDVPLASRPTPGHPTQASQSRQARQADQPGQASQATQPTQPSQPGQASQATQPSQASQATQPSQASQASQASQPAEASQAAEASGDDDLAASTESAQPTSPEEVRREASRR